MQITFRRLPLRYRYFFAKHTWNFLSCIFLWIVYFDTVRGQHLLLIAHVSCRVCFLFTFSTDPSFHVSLSHNKVGLLLRLWFSTLPRFFKRLKTQYTAGGGCFVWFAVCDTWIPALNNLLIESALACLLPVLNIYRILNMQTIIYFRLLLRPSTS